MFQQYLCRNLLRYGLTNTRPTTTLNSLNSVRQDLVRFVHKKTFTDQEIKRRSTVNYLIATVALTAGMAFAAVPLYQVFCQATGYGGTTKGHDGSNIENMEKVPDRVIKVVFNADLNASLIWNFKPQQREIKVMPGETALAFYTAKNPTNVPVIGISTYNVIPFEAGQYFNKIQCFCFEEQMLNPQEEVDMPVFFYIDPDFTKDPRMELVNEIVLSYTFFEAKDGQSILKIPEYAKRHTLTQ